MGRAWSHRQREDNKEHMMKAVKGQPIFSCTGSMVENLDGSFVQFYSFN